jgi:hypothetical protein
MGYFSERAAEERRNKTVEAGLCFYCFSDNVSESDNVMVCHDCGEAAIIDNKKE